MVSSKATFSVVMVTVFPNGGIKTGLIKSPSNLNDSNRRYTVAFVRIDDFDEQSHKKQFLHLLGGQVHVHNNQLILLLRPVEDSGTSRHSRRSALTKNSHRTRSNATIPTPPRTLARSEPACHATHAASSTRYHSATAQYVPHDGCRHSRKTILLKTLGTGPREGNPPRSCTAARDTYG